MAASCDSRTPSPKVKKLRQNDSTEKTVENWTQASVRTLQKDVAAMLKVLSDVAVRIGDLEKLVPVKSDFNKSLEDGFVERFGKIEARVLQLEHLVALFQDCAAFAGIFDSFGCHLDSRPHSALSVRMDNMESQVRELVDKALPGRSSTLADVWYSIAELEKTLGRLTTRVDYIGPDLPANIEEMMRDTHDLIVDFRSLDERLANLEKHPPILDAQNEGGERMQAGFVKHAELKQIVCKVEGLELELQQRMGQIDEAEENWDEEVSKFADQIVQLEGKITDALKRMTALEKSTSGSEAPPWASGFFDMLRDVREYSTEHVIKLTKDMKALENKFQQKSNKR